ncbi:MAG: LytTR family DNA-binding domain-containing protein [Pseudomonadota bacterium]
MSKPKHKILIVDDELPALTNVQYVLHNHPGWQLIASCHSTAQARAILQAESVDLLLLDIEMPTQSGLDFARELSLASQAPLIVFITAYNKHAVAAFELFALDYLLKPFDDERFAAMMARAEQGIVTRQIVNQSAALKDYFGDQDATLSGEKSPTLSHVVVRSMGRTERIDVNEIIWIGTAANYVEIHIDGRVILHRTTISSMEVRLPPERFLRLHRTAIVNLGAIRSLEIGEDGVYLVGLSNKDKVRVNESSVKRIKQLFSE